jgi:hypothetical protein
MITGIAKLFEAPVDLVGRPHYRRLATPYTFKPELSFTEAVIASMAAFLRIFLGSILFGFCGWYSMVALKAIHAPWWRVTAAVPMIAGFLFLFALLMAGISACVRWLMPKHSA